MYRRVLVPLDGSALAERALSHAERVVAPGGVIVLLQVLQPELVLPPLGASDVTNVREAERLARELQELVGQARSAAEAYLAKARGRLRRADVTIEGRVVEGQPVDRLVEASQEVDLVVMSTHGRTGLSHLLMGSVTERLIRHASAPVLVVRQLAGGDGQVEDAR